MKLLATVFVVLAVCQTEALPTTGDNRIEIEFSEDTIPRFSPSQNLKLPHYPSSYDGIKEEADDNRIDTTHHSSKLNVILAQYPDAQYNGMIEEMADDIEEVADDQTNAYCNDPQYCDCSLKYGSYEGTNTNTGEECTVYAVPYCEGVCSSSYR